MGNRTIAMAPDCAATLDFDTAIARMLYEAKPLECECVPISEAAGRVLAAHIEAQRHAPPVAVAAMDGYAIGAAAMSDETTLDVVGESFPGMPYLERVEAGTAVRIFTGAPMPAGASRVIVQEHVARYGNRIVVPAGTPPGRHVRQRGSDFVAGDVLLATGRLLDSRAMVAASAAGIAQVLVHRKPRLAIIACGDELTVPGVAGTSIDSVPDSNSLAVEALAREWGAGIIDLMLVKDRREQVEYCLGDALKRVDIVVMIGGASVGDRDFARPAASSIGVSETFATVAIKPGKPVWHGACGSAHVLGLPGNPTAALTTARLFLAPLLCRLGGRAASSALNWRNVPLADAAEANGDRETFLCGVWDGYRVRILDRQSASAQARLTDANALVRSPAGAPARSTGTPVSILEF